MIPKVIYMCDKELTFIEKYSQNWKKLNPEYEIKLYDDSMCEQFLLNEYSQLHCEIFKYIKDGPIKADFWRVCVLFKYGGYYIDADVEPLIPISQFVDPTADFVICTTLSFYNVLDPIFMVAEAGNSILEKCINVYIHKYIKNQPYMYWSWSILTVMTFCNVFPIDKIKKKFGIYNVNGKKIQILEERKADNTSYGDHAIYNNIRIFNCRYSNYDDKNHRFID